MRSYHRATASFPLCALLLATFAVPAAADESSSTDDKNIDTIYVTATRLEQTPAETGASISVITAAEIEELGLIYVLDAIAQAPGVTINQNGAFGGSASVRIRGASSEQTVVLIDGVPVNDPSSPGGGFNFARLDTENIERIEVLKGPQSTLWGTDAIGGVVSITTKKPEERLGGEAFAEFGSFNTLRAGASVSNAGEVGDFRLAAVSVSSDGISKADEDNGNGEDDSFDSLTLSAKGGLNLPGDARLSADVLWTDAESEFDSFFFGAEGNVADGDELSETEETAANVSLTIPAFDGRLDNLLLIGYSDIERRNSTDGAPSFAADGDRLLYRYQGTLVANDANTIAFGAEREETTANDDDTSIDGLFAIYELTPVDGVTITAGIRNDDHERFGSETTTRLASAWQLSDSVSLRASWGEGFKAPTLFQTTFFCCGATAPNADLQPETSESLDVGLDWFSEDGRFQLSATLFQQETENQIDFDFGIGGYLNIAEVESTGLELSGQVALTDALRLSLDYAFIDAEDAAGDDLARLPEHTGDLTLSYDGEGPLSGAVLVRYNGSEANNNGTTLDSWLRVDVTGRYQVSERVEIYGRIENLLDEDYQQILGYGTPDLSGSLGVRFRY
ncbi:MAG: TonB-dependent receptor [Pseudomonadota bacterium]